MITNTRSRKGWSDAVAKILKMGKAMPADLVDDLNDSIDFDAPIADGVTSNYLNRVPSRQEIPVSPTTSASGAGAEQLPKWSSDPATQSGIAELYNKFNELMAQFSELKKGQMDLLNCVVGLAKAVKPSFPDSESEDEDSSADEDDSDEAVTEKALRGLGMREGGIRDVIDAMRSANKSKMPPSFIKAAIRKAEDSVDVESLNSEEFIRYMSARNALALAASGQKVHHDILRQAALTVENPTGDAF